MCISPIANIWRNNGASEQPSGENPLLPGAAFLMDISSSVSAVLWRSAAFGRLSPSLARQQSSLLLSALTSLSHTFAKALLDPAAYGLDRPPMPLPAIQQLLGHADISTTTIYTRVSADDLARMMGTSQAL
jgi:hypothetical protein